MLPDAVIVTVSPATSATPASVQSWFPGTLTVVEPGVTFSVTVMLNGLLPAPAEVRVTVPLYWPAARPAVFTETVKVAGVVLLEVGVTESQLPVLVAAAVNVSAAPELEIDSD
jgi:hypothetical protein